MFLCFRFCFRGPLTHVYIYFTALGCFRGTLNSCLHLFPWLCFRGHFNSCLHLLPYALFQGILKNISFNFNIILDKMGVKEWKILKVWRRKSLTENLPFARVLGSICLEKFLKINKQKQMNAFQFICAKECQHFKKLFLNFLYL